MAGTATDVIPDLKTPTRRWMCANCGYTYDQTKGDPDGGIPPGTAWEDIPEDWRCPDCGAAKSDFEMVEL